jgi:hypothetical protein
VSARYLRDVSSITPSTDVDNVILLRSRLEARIHISRQPSPFDRLTAELVLAQFRAGTLPEPVLVYLLAGVGLWP